MSARHEEQNDLWPVTYPAKSPPQPSGRRYEGSTPRRWTGVDKVDTGEVQKRFLWLLLAIEIGMALAAACVLPLAFLNVPVQEEGIVGAISHQVGHLLGLSSQVTCVILGLPITILLLALAFSLGVYRWLQQSGKGRKSQGKR